MGNNKIVLLSTGQPSLNPRLVKEADALANSGYEVTVLYSYWNQWGAELDKILLPSKSWKAICIGGDPHQRPFAYLCSKLIFRASKIINRILKGGQFAELAIARNSFFLKRAAKQFEADIYIGHNLGALPATVMAAAVNKKPCGFDAEDFHRNEVSNDDRHPDVVIKTYLENKYFPSLGYLSVSSPLIAAAYLKIFPGLAPRVILNVFPKGKDSSEPAKNGGGPVRLFWFSQTIGHGRGLEEVIEAMDALTPYPFELHLLGQPDHSFRDAYRQKESIHFHAPIPSERIFFFASQFDIGLAVETGVPFNRDICLTNKIFTYIQSGLCVVASDTKAQSLFMSEYPGVGKVYTKRKPQELANILLHYHQHKDKLIEARRTALALAANELNWELERGKFLGLVEQTLHGHQ